VAGVGHEGTALYLAAHGADVTTVDEQPAEVERVIAAAEAAGLTDHIRGFIGDIGHWAPDVPFSAVVCSSRAFENLSAPDRWRVIDRLQDATRRGGVHLVEPIVGGDAPMTLEELRLRYKGWEISARRPRMAPESFFARKAVA
jgi:hypothetical protein